jgi:DNA polymerase-3 subunit delta'
MLMSNEKKWQYLHRLVGTNKLPHAILVSGVSAAEFVARIFGQDVMQKIHPDFIFVEPEKKEIQISQIRDCIWRLSLRPWVSAFKVAIVEQAHLMNQEAQTALLKTLEEPKGQSLLILFTDYPDALFPTILSRVQRIKFFRAAKEKAKSFAEIAELTKADLTARFQCVEKIYKSPELNEILEEWLHYFRKDLINNKAILQKLQTTYYLISKTNINPRLALETLMLDLQENV